MMKNKKDYSNIINDKNYEGYIALCNAMTGCFRRGHQHLKKSNKNMLKVLVFAVIGMIISMVTSSLPLTLLVCSIACGSVVFSSYRDRIILKKDEEKTIKKVLDKYPYVDPTIPSDELIIQLLNVESQSNIKCKNTENKLEENKSHQDVRQLINPQIVSKSKSRRKIKKRY